MYFSHHKEKQFYRSLDGKRTSMRKANQSGSQSVNWNNFLSKVLMFWQMQVIVLSVEGEA